MSTNRVPQNGAEDSFVDQELGAGERTSEHMESIKQKISDGVSITMQDICYTVVDRSTKKDIKLLSNVSGAITSGDMYALMGPSGEFSWNDNGDGDDVAPSIGM